MENVEQALEILRSILKLDRLAFNDHGQAAILVENLFSIDISRQSDEALELSFRLELLAGELTLNRAIGLLTSNYLGHYTGSARIALDPRDGEPVLCQRLTVTRLDAASLEASLVEFLGYVAYWAEKGTTRILDLPKAEPKTRQDATSGTDEFVLMRL